MISIDLSGKTILITGALGAIAEPMVQRLAESGARLVLTDIKTQEQGKEKLVEWHIPPSYYSYIPADITHSSQVNRVVSAAFEQFPGMDTVIGHAGGCGLHPFQLLRRKRTIASASSASNYFAQTYLARAVLAQWIERKIAGPPDLHIFLCGARAAYLNPGLLLG